MPLLQLFARVLLAVVFFVASLVKLFDRNGTKKAVIDFGSPTWLAIPAAIALPLAEMAVAGLLVPVRTAWAAALGAFALLLSFIVVIGVNMAHGRKPDCHCFGQIHSEPIGWRTLARNGALALCAGLVVFNGRISPGISAVGWVRGLTPGLALGVLAGGILSTALAVEGWLLLNLTRQNGRLLLRMEDLENRLGAPAIAQSPTQAPVQVGLPIGALAPEFKLPMLSGGMLSLDMLRRDRLPVLLIFSDPNCGPCSALLPEIGIWQQDYAGQIAIAVVSRGDAKANRAKADQYKVMNILLQKDREVAEQYQANGTPAAVLTRPDGKISSRVVMGAEAIRNLVVHATGVALPVPGNGNGKQLAGLMPLAGLPIGTPSPTVNLPDLAGKTVTLEAFKGTKTLLLFWNPGCSYCQRMLPQLIEWEKGRPKSAPRIVLVSSGSRETNLQMRLESEIILDERFVVGQSYGANGTPSAVLIDGNGRIASRLAVGAPGIFDLLSTHESDQDNPAIALAAANLSY